MSGPVYIGEVEIHPAAQMFPEMGHDELTSLVSSIRRDGFTSPIVFYGGKLLDGRNRVRAAGVAGIPVKDIPKVNIPEKEDPYLVAFDFNCERFQYTAGQKADLWVRINEESGRLAEREAERKEKANKKRSEAAKAQHAVSNPRAGEHKPKSGVHPDGCTPKKAVELAEEVAAEIDVSKNTVARALTKAKRGRRDKPQLPPKRARSTNWSVPRDMRKLAVFLLQRVPSDEIKKLVRALTDGVPAEEAAQR